ncbi:MAG TPA: adenine deaminase [Candidatus Atribacteria bacterium]|nr:adenine deaminase [Candidatus Atribacteria bacterium]
MNLSEIIKVARGEKKADLLLKNGNIINVFSGEIYATDVAIYKDKIVGVGKGYDADRIIDISNNYLSPGFIDGHIHLESSMVKVSEFANTVVPLGTTSVIIDPHEIANVLGLEGIRYMLESSKYAPINVFMMLPSCVPASPLGTSGADLGVNDLYPLLDEKWVLGLGEMMNFPGVLNKNPEVLDKIVVSSHKCIDGHAPNLSGKDLCAYISAQIKSEHECTTVEEAQEKLRLGMYIMLREGSVTRNLNDLLPLINLNNSRRCFFCCDDRHPKDLIEEGHINYIIKTAIRGGIDPVTAIRMATLNTTEYFRLRNLGAIAPGYTADLVVFDNFEDFNILKVFRNGELIAENGELKEIISKALDVPIRSSVNIKWLYPEDFQIPVKGNKCRVIKILPDQIITEIDIETPRINNGWVVSDIKRDILKVAVIERHHASQKVSLGLVKGIGLKKGALGSSIAHDSHNIIIIGTNDKDMLNVGANIAKMGGGLAISVDEKIVDSLPLPIAGLMSDRPLSEVKEKLDSLYKISRNLGVKVNNPFMSIAFLSLEVVPHFKITNKGLVDVDNSKIVDLFLE